MYTVQEALLVEFHTDIFGSIVSGNELQQETVIPSISFQSEKKKLLTTLGEGGKWLWKERNENTEKTQRDFLESAWQLLYSFLLQSENNI